MARREARRSQCHSGNFFAVGSSRSSRWQKSGGEAAVIGRGNALPEDFRSQRLRWSPVLWNAASWVSDEEIINLISCYSRR